MGSKRIKKFKWLYHHLGWRAAFFMGFLPLLVKKENYEKMFNKGVIYYFRSFRYRGTKKTSDTEISEDTPIWTCWIQGTDSMPEIIRICHSSLLKHAGKHPVHLITLENYKEYINIPDYVLKKLSDGNISFAHFSDVLRVALLARYGGLWLDATIFVTRDIGAIPMPFFSMKQLPMDNKHVSMYRWTSFCLGGVPDLPLFVYLRDVLLYYWKVSDTILEYLMFDSIIAAAYEKKRDVKNLIDNVPYNNPQLYELSYVMNRAFDSSLFDKILSETYFHKLTWKADFVKVDEKGEQTFYGYLSACKNIFANG